MWGDLEFLLSLKTKVVDTHSRKHCLSHYIITFPPFSYLTALTFPSTIMRHLSEFSQGQFPNFALATSTLTSSPTLPPHMVIHARILWKGKWEFWVQLVAQKWEVLANPYGDWTMKKKKKKTFDLLSQCYIQPSWEVSYAFAYWTISSQQERVVFFSQIVCGRGCWQHGQ